MHFSAKYDSLTLQTRGEDPKDLLNRRHWMFCGESLCPRQVVLQYEQSPTEHAEAGVD